MKKILSILGTVGLSVTTSSTVIACQKKVKEDKKDKNKEVKEDKNKEVKEDKNKEVKEDKNKEVNEVKNKEVNEVKKLDLNNFKKPKIINAFNIDYPTEQEVLDDINRTNGTDLELEKDVAITIEGNKEEGSFIVTIEPNEESKKIKSESKTTNLEFDKVEKRKDWTGDYIRNESLQWTLSDYIRQKSINIWIPKSAIKEGKVKFNDTELSKIIWIGFLNEDRDKATTDFDKKQLEKYLHFTGNVNEVLNEWIKQNIEQIEQTKKGEVVDIDIIIEGENNKDLGVKLDKDLLSWIIKKGNDNEIKFESWGIIPGEITFSGLLLSIIC